MMRLLFGIGMVWFWFLLLVVIGLLIYAWLKGNPNSDRYDFQDSTTDEALRILNERFARGEISEEEYLRRKALIQRDRQ